MKPNQIPLYLLLILIYGYSNAQTIINGDFENHISTGCDYNNTDLSFNSKFETIKAFGNSYNPVGGGFVGEVDIQTFGCNINPQNGSWCLGLSSGTITSNDADAISLQLTSNLIIGQTYRLSFYLFSNLNDNLNNLKIGLSSNSASFGNLVYTAVPINNYTWNYHEFDFVATDTSNYLTVSNTPGMSGWNQIDNFSLNNVLSTSEFELNKLVLFPNPFSFSTTVKSNIEMVNARVTVYNTLGQEVKKIENINGYSVEVFRENLSKGIYFIKTEQDNKVLSINKVIID